MREVTRSRPVNLFAGAALFAVILLGINFAVTLLVSDQAKRAAFADVAALVVDFLASTALFLAARKTASYSKRIAVAWGLIGCAIFAFALGDTVWAILELGLKKPPFPSIADVFYLAYYPSLLAGVFLLLDKPATVGRANQERAGRGNRDDRSDSRVLEFPARTDCFLQCWRPSVGTSHLNDLSRLATLCCYGHYFELFTAVSASAMQRQRFCSRRASP